MISPLQRTLLQLLEARVQFDHRPYTVPGAWVGDGAPVVFPSGAEYLLHQIMHVRDLGTGRSIGSASRTAMEQLVIYGASVRHVTSYSHGEASERGGWRSTGTFLKLIGLLPYLVRKGITAISLLPITEIGLIGRKGTLGSPYAVKHPLHLDPMLAEPNVAMSLEDQARLCIELCHHVGIRVLVESVLRTASVDSDLVGQHPEWFYWVDEERTTNAGGYRAPEFSPEDVSRMESMVERQMFRHLPAPPLEYTTMFSSPPWRLACDERGWKGFGAHDRVVRVPPAFADWPVDDPQPAWTDVTYLKLHDHPQFNYVAYNTIRMYDAELDVEPYRRTSLWNTIAAIVPTMMRNLDLDGSTLDMGHALPKDLAREVIRGIRRARPDTLLISEQFVPQASGSTEAADQYDAVVGFLPLVRSDAEAVLNTLREFAFAPPSQYLLATPETHNTPRACATWGSIAHAHGLWLFLQGLPRTISFLHAGMEFGETVPVNTGLGFSDEDRQRWTPDDLPLFSDVPLPWDRADCSDLMDRFRSVRSLDAVQRFAWHDPIEVLEGHTMVPAYLRWVEHESRGSRGIIFCWNAGTEPVVWRCRLPPRVQAVAVYRNVLWTPPTLTVTLQPGETRVLPIHGVRQRKSDAGEERS